MTPRFPIRLWPALLLAAGVALPSATIAAPCAGFADVDDSSAFCPNVEWVRNRSVTLGCTSTSAYCPNDAVTRLSMAAFLHRFANAMTPDRLGEQGGGGTTAILDLDAASLHCRTAPNTAYYVVQQPRFAHGVGHFLAGNGPQTSFPYGPADVAVQIVESTDRGVSWQPASPIHVGSRDGDSASVSVILTPRDLAVGAELLYALRVSRAPGSSTGDLPGSQCQLHILLENRNPTSSPFDADD